MSRLFFTFQNAFSSQTLLQSNPLFICSSSLDSSSSKSLCNLFPSNYSTISKRVLPRDSDYSGSLWHGHYVGYLEEARVHHLAELGLDYSVLVNQYKTELVVYELEIKYLIPAKLGQILTIGVGVIQQKAKFVVEGMMVSVDEKNDMVIHAKSKVVLVPVDLEKGGVRRKLPDVLVNAMKQNELRKESS